MTETPERKKITQISLSTIMLVVALVALSMAWWLDHRSLTHRLRDAERRIQFLQTAPFVDGEPTAR